MKVLTAEGMAAVDRHAIDQLGVPVAVLMENAALGTVDALLEARPQLRSACVLCGPGNNGGDGFAVARQLATRAVAVSAFLVGGGRAPSAEAAAQLAILRRLGVPTAELAPTDPLEDVLVAVADAEVVVDALYGTGLTRPLEGQAAALVEALNGLAVPRLAVDLPSGLLASRASLPGPHLRADWTVTFATLKVAHVLSPAAEACGRVIVADLGIPWELVAEAPGDLHLEVPEALAAALPVRPRASHKGDFGHVLVVGGSAGKAGAAALMARGAVRTGAGLVTAAVPAPTVPVIAAAALEAMTLSLPAGPDGAFTLAAVEPILAAAAARDVLAIGPGLGTSAEAREAARRIVLGTEKMVVVDADAINAFAGRAEELRTRRAVTVLTPHPGELGRLLGTSASEVVGDRLAALARAVEATGAHVVLKGHQTLIGTPSGRTTINPTGNPGMASGGVGDVLTGMVAALLGQRIEAELACRLGVYLHGLAGDLAATAGDPACLTASDLLGALPEAFRRLRSA